MVSEAHGRAASSLPIADIAIAQWLIAAARERTDEDVVPNEHLVSVAVERTDGSAPLPMASDMQTVVLIGRDDVGDLIRFCTNPACEPCLPSI